MIASFRQSWRIYLIEAWALGMFMISACFFVILLEHPQSPLNMSIPSQEQRRILIGIAMGITAVLLIYSPWGKRSGAHMNPAVTLAFWQLNRISGMHAIWYILAQFTGGLLGVLCFRILTPEYINTPEVNYIVTVPGSKGLFTAFLAEFGMAFLLFFTVLLLSNSRFARWTGCVAGILIALFISFEAPYSGMSINPARTMASALAAGVWSGWWIYFTAPVAGMLLAAQIFRARYMAMHDGDCRTLQCRMTDGEMEILSQGA